MSQRKRRLITKQKMMKRGAVSDMPLFLHNKNPENHGIIWVLNGHKPQTGILRERMAEMEIRFAAEEDARALLEIYGQYIDTPITFEYTLPTAEEFAGRIREITAFYPYLVCVDEGKITGYAYAHRQKERAAYQWNAELSVYLDKNHCFQGLGRKMYGLLMELLKLQGIKTVYGVVTSPNAASEGLHEAMRFRRQGLFRNTGYKNGAWRDVVWFEKDIAPYDPEPRGIISLWEVENIEKILEDLQ